MLLFYLSGKKVSALRPYSPGGGLNDFSTALAQPVATQTPSSHRLQPGLPGYLVGSQQGKELICSLPISNPVRSPGFRPSPSDIFQPSAFATGGPYGITGFHPYPISTLGLSDSQALQYPQQINGWAAEFDQELTGPATDTLDPVILPTTRGAGFTAAAGT